MVPSLLDVRHRGTGQTDLPTEFCLRHPFQPAPMRHHQLTKRGIQPVCASQHSGMLAHQPNPYHASFAVEFVSSTFMIRENVFVVDISCRRDQVPVVRRAPREFPRGPAIAPIYRGPLTHACD